MTDNLDQQGSPERFGYSWATYNQVLPESKQQLERWLGSTPLKSFSGKRVLDVGCGMGRNPYWFLMSGASEVVACDIAESSLEQARRNLSGFPNARVERCSAYDLDFGTFDRVTCIGVLHHLGEPQRALERMWASVAPGGELHLWCYAREGNEFILPLILAAKGVGARLPIVWTHRIAKVLALLLWPIFRVFPFRTEYYRRLRELSFSNVEHIIFDQMLPSIANYWTRQDMLALLQPLGGEIYLEFVQGNSWHACVRKT